MGTLKVTRQNVFIRRKISKINVVLTSRRYLTLIIIPAFLHFDFPKGNLIMVH